MKGGDDAGPVSGNRRSFLGALVALGSFCVGGLLSVPLIRFALFPLLRRTTELKESPVGPSSQFSSLTEPIVRTIQIEQLDGWRKAVSEKAVYVTKGEQGKLCVLSSICPHLGCTLPWVSGKKAFVCPCHGSEFNTSGRVLSGPAQAALSQFGTQFANNVLTVTL